MRNNHYIFLFTLLIIFSYTKVFSQQINTDAMINRKPAVASKFYSGDKSSLTNDLIHLFAPAKERQKDAIAVISPHAGYVFSGEVAASAINQINPDKEYDNIFILATSHTTYFKGASIYNTGNYETPLGEVSVNTELCNKLIKENDIFSSVPAAHTTEHSIEVQLPFLQMHLKNNFQIIPIVIGSGGESDSKVIAEALKPFFNDKNIFVISSDFSHYPEYDEAVKVDSITADAMCSGEPEALLEVISSYKKTDVENLATNICAWSAALTLMYLADGKYDFNKIQYKNSGDSEYGSHDRVVGYWAISVTKKQEEDSSFKLTDEEKIQLLKLARTTIREDLDNKHTQTSSSDYSENLNKHCGAFVTLHKDGKLRGCIGQFEPNIPLYKVISQMAIASSQNDHRFSPVTLSELEDIDIEISVLTPMKKIDSIDEIELGKHGIYIKKGYYGGTFLPQVATETGWSLEEFLGHCARDKAGIGYTGWQDENTTIYTYEAIIFSEKEFDNNQKEITKYYKKLEKGRVECTLCPHGCILVEGQSGLCNARKNIDEKMQSLTYGKLVAIHIDPVEKKPLYHFHPGTNTLSIGTAGCNLHCKNCQNSHISQKSPDDLSYTASTPQQIIDAAIKNDCQSISYTYTEPTIFYEFMLETAKLAHKNGLKNIIVSNGYINQEPLLELVPYIDGANIDLKCFNDSIYKKMTTANLQPVLNTLKILKENGVWLEITNLVIPQWTDNMKMIDEMCGWLVENNFTDVPLHFSRFHPSYKMDDIPPTPTETLEKAYNIAKEKGIKYVYIGNLLSDKNNTFCPYCGDKVINRDGFNSDTGKFDGICPACGVEMNGVW